MVSKVKVLLVSSVETSQWLRRVKESHGKKSDFRQWIGLDLHILLFRA